MKFMNKLVSSLLILTLFFSSLPVSIALASDERPAPGVIHELPLQADSTSLKPNTYPLTPYTVSYPFPRQTDPFKGVITASGTPSPGQQLSVTFTIIPEQDLEQVSLRLSLPYGTELLSGKNALQSSARKGVSLSHSVTIKPSLASSGNIKAEASASINGRQVSRSYYYSLNTLTPGDVSIQQTPDGKSVQVSPAIPLEGGPVIIASSQSSIRANITVSATFKYDVSGTQHPMRQVYVELVDMIAPGSTYDVVTAAYTDNNGFIQFIVDNTDSQGDGTGRDVRLRAYAWNTAAYTVTSHLGTTKYVTQTSASLNVLDGTTVNFGSLIPAASHEAWEAADAMLGEYLYIQASAGWVRSPIRIEWPVGNWPTHYYSYYMPSGAIADEWVEMPAKSTASWDKVVIYHEYGHAVMLEAYGRNRNNMPPKTYASGHYIFSETDPAFAIIEGWAEFMQTVVSNDPNNMVQLGMNFESNTWYDVAYGVISDSGDMDGNYVEGSAASIMWDIYDNPPVDDDILSLGFNPIMTLMRLDRPQNMLDFWSKWVARYGATPGLAQIYHNYGIVLEGFPVEVSTISWIRQFGTSVDDSARDLAIDNSGNIYVTGYTSGAFTGQSNSGNEDVFLRKYDTSGNALWTQQFGSSANDEPYSVAVDNSGNVYVAGYTKGTLPGQISSGYEDAFLRKYDAAGSAAWTRQFGSSSNDWARSVIADGSGNVYIAGYTWGTLPYQASSGSRDAFLRKYDAAGSAAWTRQFGTSAEDASRSLAIDGSGNVYVAGYTYGTLPNQASSGMEDAFIRKYDASGNELWTRQFGSSNSDYANSVALDGSGDIYVAGSTAGAFTGQSNSGYWDAFIRKYNESGSELWTRQFGSAMNDYAYKAVLDTSGNSYIAGQTYGTFPGQTSSGGSDAFVKVYDSLGSVLWTRQFGSSNYDFAWSVARDSQNNIYAVGYTEGALTGQINSGGADAFILKFLKSTTSDATPPGPAGNLTSPTHTTGTWSKINVVTVTWTAAIDQGGGVLDGYSSLWDRNPATIPEATTAARNISGTATSAYSPILSDDNNYYFHIRPVDNYGNWGSAQHLGPFNIDTIPPDPVSGLTSPTATGTWVNISNIAVSWATATDTRSGLDGYSIAGDSNSATIPPSAKVFEETTTSISAPVIVEGSWYFHIRPVDNAGNWATASHLGPFLIDITNPDAPTLSNPSPNSKIATASPIFSWGAVMELSGVSYRIQIATMANFSILLAEQNNLATTTYSTSPFLDGTYYWQVKARDGAGNESPWASASFTIDSAAPGVVALSSPADIATLTFLPTLSWNPVADLSGVTYNLLVDDDNSFSSPAVSIAWIASPTFTISSNMTSTTAYYWKVRAIDGAGNMGDWSSARSFSLSKTATAGATLAKGWNMISSPLSPDPATIGYQLGDNMAPPVLLYSYNPSNRTYISYASAAPMSIGMGYWIKPTTTTYVSLEGISPGASGTFILSLQVGWNMIGYPFGSTLALNMVHVLYQGQEVNLNTAEINGWLYKTFYTYNPSSRTYAGQTPGTGQLEPFKGYWVKAKVPLTLLIPPP